MDLARAEALTREKMKEHGLQSWDFYFDSAVRRHGCCHWSTKQISLSEIWVSLNDEAMVLNTILHEIAHALCHPNDMHNHIWKAKAIEIGCNGERCTSGGVTMPKPFKAVCPNCGQGWTGYKRTKTACGACCKKFNGGKFTRLFMVKWTRVDE